ncbi:MAG: hypothetical protein H0U54_15815 [Acidobacteria bacterium]|nr:hypothetical protein [Acidobacteriota bacterium]
MPSSRWLKAVPSPEVSADQKSVATPNVSMSDLRRLEREKQQKNQENQPPVSAADNSSIPQHGIPLESILSAGIPEKGIPTKGIPQKGIGGNKVRTTKKQVETSPLSQASAERGFYPTFNDLDDLIIPGYKLDPYEQTVLRRLYRLSRGFRSVDCEAGLGALAKACNIARSQAQKTIASLMTRGLIRSLGHSQAGTKYRVLEQLPAMPPKGIPGKGIPQGGEGVPQDGARGIPQEGNNKYNKDLINTHKNTASVSVGSKFMLEECRRYAQHLQSTGQGINNPGGYATTIHRTGEADLLIESFLNPTTATQIDSSQCPDCKGSGFYYPNGPSGGVVKCKHEKLILNS